jgi:hypothetical protein
MLFNCIKKLSTSIGCKMIDCPNNNPRICNMQCPKYNWRKVTSVNVANINNDTKFKNKDANTPPEKKNKK